MKLRHHSTSARAAALRRGSGRERGAALVELALVALLIATISAGAFDYGMAYREALAVNEAARTAARTASAMGDNPKADYYALSGAKAALTNSGRINDVTKVVIYKSNTVDGKPPALCLTAATGSLACTVLSGQQFRDLAESDFDATTGCFTPSAFKNWCPSSRINVQLTAEYYGIWIQAKYAHQFKLLSSSTTVTRTAVMRLEPDV